MSSIRLRIREEVARRLRCGKTFAGDRYFTNRFRPILQTNQAANDQPNLPMGVVYTLAETAELSASAPREYKRSMEMAIELIVARTGRVEDDADDRLDELVDQVERIMFFDASLGLGRVDVTYLKTDFVPADQGDLAYGIARVVFTVDYWQMAGEGDPDTLPDLKEIDLKYRSRSGTVLIEEEVEIPVGG